MRYATPNEWDDNALKMMGVSVKKTDTPIGEFGTGLKYAIAFILRNGYKVSLEVDQCVRHFHTKTAYLRGVAQEIVYLGDEQLPFALDYGSHWEAWMANREFIANTLDEGGEWSETAEGRVVFDTDLPFLNPMIASNLPEVYDCDAFTVYKGNSEHLYYKGFRVREIKSAYTWNFKRNLALTEDRILASSNEARRKIAHYLESMPEIVVATVCQRSNKWEASVPLYESDITPPVIEILKKYNIHSLRDKAVNAIKKYNPTPYIPSPSEYQMIEAAKALCPIPITYPIMALEPQFKDHIAEAKDETIIITPQIFAYGLQKIATILLEEQVHLEFDIYDCTREMQNFLFERWFDAEQRANNSGDTGRTQPSVWPVSE